MQFVVRYWSSKLPEQSLETDGSPHMVDYSTHPATKLGLHSALLSHHDRNEILASHGGIHCCEVFVVEARASYVLTQDMAAGLFYGLPDGEVKWTTIREFLLPQSGRESYRPPNTTHERQMQLFEYTHPADDEPENHQLDFSA
jgi:hypothetical protein